MKEWDLDSILEELEQMEPAIEPTPAPAAEPESVAEPEPTPVEELEPIESEETEPEVEKPSRLLSLRRKKEKPVEEPAEEADAGAEETPAEEPAAEPEKKTLPPEEAVTRMVDLGLSPEDLEPEAEPEDDTALEEALQESRRKQLEHFRNRQETVGSPIRLVGEEEEHNDPEEEPEPEIVEEEPHEFTSFEDGKTLLRELRFRRTTGLAMAALTVILEMILLALSLITFFAGGIQTDVMVFLAIQSVLFLILMAGCNSVIGDGWKALLRGAPTNETPAAVVAVFVLIHTLLQFVTPYQVAQRQVDLLTSVAGLQLLFCVLARQMRWKRVYQNLRMAASEKNEKYAARQITDAKIATLIGHNAVAAGSPLVTYFRKTPFLKNFLAYSYGKDYNESGLKRLVPVGFGVAIAMAALYGWLVPEVHWLSVVSVFTGVLALAMPAAALVISRNLSRAAQTVRKAGGMLSGQVAVDEFGDMDGLAVDASQLFATPGSIQMLGIKTFADAQIDTAILDAAAVCIKAASPLSGVFRQVIEDREDYLQEVDTLVYEQDMGISGWVGGRRVLVGSRQLLQNHGVDVPSGDYESRYAGEDRKLVYLSTGGTLTAMFVVTYRADAALARALRKLTAQGVSVLIRSCDPNITEELVCELFGLDDYYVEILTSAAGSAYVGLTEETDEEDEAVLASDGRLTGMIRGVTLCHVLRRLQGRLAVWQTIGSLLAAVGYGLAAIVGQVLLPAPLMVLFFLVWTGVPLLIGNVRLR